MYLPLSVIYFSFFAQDPCHRWGGIGECNCPKGPKACICNKAPKPPTDPTSCGLQPADEVNYKDEIFC